MISVAQLAAEYAALAVLLFFARYVLQGNLVPQLDQECYIGGIAHEVLAHGVRFPIATYAPNEYDNGSFVSGLATAGAFRVLGQSLLALKLVTHAFASAGALAALRLLRACLDELELERRAPRVAAQAALVLSLALAPRAVTLFSMNGVANHAEGSAIAMVLVALFARRARTTSAGVAAAFWALAGFGLYVNKGAFVAVALCAAAEAYLSRGAPVQWIAAVAGFALGLSPEAYVIWQRRAQGWAAIADKSQRNTSGFPRHFLESSWPLADFKPELLALWLVALAVGSVLAWRAMARARSRESAELPVAVALAATFAVLNVAALAAMARGGVDPYTLYVYPALAVLVAMLVGVATARVGQWRGARTAAVAGVLMVAVLAVFNRPMAANPGWSAVRALAANRDGAVCSWRFAEGFLREYRERLVPSGRTALDHVVWRCRSLAGEDQIADCIGGIARELNWRHPGSHLPAGETPPGLSDAERRAYAFQWGTHRRGDTQPCDEFVTPALRDECVQAVALDCLGYADIFSGFVTGHTLSRPRCEFSPVPMGGYWEARRQELLGRPAGSGWELSSWQSNDDVRMCGPVFERCYGAPPAAR